RQRRSASAGAGRTSRGHAAGASRRGQAGAACAAAQALARATAPTSTSSTPSMVGGEVPLACTRTAGLLRRRTVEGSRGLGRVVTGHGLQCAAATPEPLETGGSTMSVPPCPSSERWKLPTVYWPSSATCAVCVPSVIARVPPLLPLLV